MLLNSPYTYVITSLIKTSENRLSVRELCKTANISRNKNYACVKAAPVHEASEEQERKDFGLILEPYKVLGYKKGAKSIYIFLLHMDPPVVMNLKKIRRFIKKSALVAQYTKRIIAIM